MKLGISFEDLVNEKWDIDIGDPFEDLVPYGGADP